LGEYLLYHARGSRYLTYIKSWVDRFVDSNGHINNSFNSLDSMESGNVVLAMYGKTHENKYKVAAKQNS